MDISSVFFFFFQICEVGGLLIIPSELSQIWQYVGKESRFFFGFFLYFHNMVEVLCTKPAGKKIPVDLTVARR
jgi:hypothetical protein